MPDRDVGRVVAKVGKNRQLTYKAQIENLFLKPMEKVTGSFDTLLDSLEKTGKMSKKALAPFRKDAEEAVKGLRKMNEGTENFQDQIHDLEKHRDKNRADDKEFDGGLVFGNLFGDAYEHGQEQMKRAESFVKNLYDIGKARNWTRKETRALGKEVADLASKYDTAAVSFDSHFEAMDELRRLSVESKDDLKELSGSIALASEASGMSIRDTSSDFVQMRYRMGMSNDQMLRFWGNAKRISGALSVEFSELRETVDKFSSSLSDATMDLPKAGRENILKNLTMMKGAFSNAYIDADNMIQKLTEAMTDPYSESSSQIAALVGVTGEDLREMLSKETGAREVMQRMVSTLKDTGAKTAEEVAAIRNVFGLAAGDFSIFAESGDGLVQTMGDLQEGFKTSGQSTKFMTDNLKENTPTWERWGKQLSHLVAFEIPLFGVSMMGMKENASDLPIGLLITNFGGLGTAIKEMGMSTVKWAGKGAVRLFDYVFAATSTTTALGAMATAETTAAGATGLFAGGIAVTIGWIVLAVAAIAALGYAIYWAITDWEGFKTAVMDTGKAIWDFTKWVAEMAYSVSPLKLIVDTFGMIRNAAGEVWDVLFSPQYTYSEGWLGTLQGLLRFAATPFRLLGQAAAWAYEKVSGLFNESSGMMDVLSKLAMGLLGKAIIDKITPYWEGFKASFQRSWEVTYKTVFEPWVKGFELLMDLAVKIWDSFAWAAEQALGGLKGLFNSKFIEPINKVLNFGVGGLTVGSKIGMQPIPLLQEGGMVLEPTLIGAGERGPEVVAPLPDLASTMAQAMESYAPAGAPAGAPPRAGNDEVVRTLRQMMALMERLASRSESRNARDWSGWQGSEGAMAYGGR